MSNKNPPQDPDDDDAFEQERLYDSSQRRAFREAQKSKQDSFTSFSEGMPTIDKFEILGDPNEEVKKPDQPVASAHTTQQTIPFHGSPTPASTAPRQVSQSTAETSEKPAVKKKTKGVMRSLRAGEDPSFTSFSDGLPTIDKFSILDPESAPKLLSMREFLHTSTCVYFSEKYWKTTDTPPLSPTLARLMYLIDIVPWQDSLYVELVNKPDFKEFCFDEKTFVLDKSVSDEETILAFAHQAYHATNRLLTKLYEDEMLDRDIFVDLYIWAEVAALITELNVRRELSLDGVTPRKVLCQERDGSLHSINVEEHLKQQGMKAMHDTLYYSMVRGTDDMSVLNLYSELFNLYATTYEAELAVETENINRFLAAGVEHDCI